MAPLETKLRVCVLQCSYVSTDSCFKELDPYCTPEVYDKDGKYIWSHAYIHKATAVRQVRELVQSGKVDVFLNLCDGAHEEDRAGKEVVETLERLGAAYTGADATFYEPSKALMKKMAYYYDVPTAPWALLMSVDMQDDILAAQQCSQAAAGLRYPLIVKHYSGGGSVGMGRDCKVHDLESLVQQARKFVGQFGGALIEEFIEGREFTVLVIENGADAAKPISLTPVECIFGKGETFKHFDLKWKDYESMRWQALDDQAEPELSAALRTAAATAFVALKGTSYGRADFRVDSQGRVYFLEHNPNCGVFYPPDAMGSADYILSLDPKVNHARFIDYIISAAIARRDAQLSEQSTKVVYQHQRGFGLYATRNIRQGETIIRYEERPHVLVSASHVEKIFGKQALQWPIHDHIASEANTPANDSMTCSDAVSDAANSSALADVASSSDTDGPAPVYEIDVPSDTMCDSVDQPIKSKQVVHGKKEGQGIDCSKPRTNMRCLEWFRAYAYPITDETWVTWSEDPDEWLPLNHSCNPNAWLTGLDLTARRDIKPGEQITAEYATFTVHNMSSFKCQCGAAGCRGLVGGQDHLAAWVGQMYEGHLSDYVAAKRRQHAGLIKAKHAYIH